MLIGYKDDENDTHTSTRTSTHTSSIDIQPSSENVMRLVLAIGKEEMSVKSMMEAVGLKEPSELYGLFSRTSNKRRICVYEVSCQSPSSPSTLFADGKRIDVVGRK